MMQSNRQMIAVRKAADAAKRVNTISMTQARIVLDGANLLSRVEAEIVKADKHTQIAWEYSAELRRDSEVLKALAVKLKLSDEEVDALFKQASSVRF